MNIKHGDVITLENGDVVKVSLKLIKKKITELVPGKYYTLRYTTQFCHWYDSDGSVRGDKLAGQVFQYIGEVITSGVYRRAVFYATEGTSYLMMGCDNLDYVIDEVNI